MLTMGEDSRIQFNVHLPPDLVCGVEHRRTDEALSLSALVEQTLRACLVGT